MSRSLLRGQTIEVMVRGSSSKIPLVTCVLAATKIISLQSEPARTLCPDRYRDIAHLCMTIYVGACDQLQDEREVLLAEQDAWEALDVIDGMTHVEQQLHMLSLVSRLSFLATMPDFERTVINGLLTVATYTYKNLEALLPEVTRLQVPALTVRDYDVFRVMVVIGFELTYQVDDERISTLTEELIDRFSEKSGQEVFDPMTRKEQQTVFNLVETSLENLEEWSSGALSIMETAVAFYSSDQPDPLIDSLFVQMLQQRLRLYGQPEDLKH